MTIVASKRNEIGRDVLMASGYVIRNLNHEANRSGIAYGYCLNSGECPREKNLIELAAPPQGYK